ncbi:hypothetical protein [Sphingobacterium sp. SGL-16]|uniref:hypothetical protein n=1 Tax=Sphingobacterium sp. SGL-16 TaxID=2710883 RepID=UPI0013ECD041|nr:hypothetical protein [Sphingobacterium sp. SGL-16]NGM72836.1 hypothetical protein [Sphingobacterium sp. SGL-16]
MNDNTIIGVISEGPADRAVITNVLKCTLGIDDANIRALLPINKTDETDRARIKGNDEFGGWSSVKNECIEKKIINQFLAIDGQDFIIIHLDTAEASQYGVLRIPEKNDNYAVNLRELVVEIIDGWLENQEVIDSTLHAVAVEEIDAWLLTIYDVGKDSCKSTDPKKKLGFILGKNQINSTSDYDNYLKLSKPFSKPKEVKRNKFSDFNASLKEFINEVITKTKS